MSEALQEAIVYAIVGGSAIWIAVRFGWPRRAATGCDKCPVAQPRAKADRRVHLTVLD